MNVHKQRPHDGNLPFLLASESAPGKPEPKE